MSLNTPESAGTFAPEASNTSLEASTGSQKLDFSKKNCILLAAVTLSFAAFCIETDIYAPSFPIWSNILDPLNLVFKIS